jgi:DNA replication initiation complex subunit (GINS family)
MRAEHKSAGITKINPGLYRALNQYLQRLHDAYLEAHAENKTQKALTLTKEIRDTERDISTIYELRERKVLLMAQDIVRGGAPTLKYLFPEEKLLLLRLSSILLEMRKDIKIDFHHRVDNYIKTIAKEYDLERKLFAPFHPTEPFCDETSPELPAEAEIESSDSFTPPPHIVIANDVTGSAEAEGETSNNSSENNNETNQIQTQDNLGDTPPHDVRSEQSSTSPIMAEEGMNDALDELVEDDEQESSDFLKDYAITGTLDSIPQFRASDLHDYHFETGEIITLPLKMAELLEKQGKLFIVEMTKKENETS